MADQPVRLTFQKLQLLVTLFYSTRASCDRLRTATTLWDNKNRLISAGYNGAIAGQPDCDQAGHLIVENHCIRTNHGEENAILNSQNLHRLQGSMAVILGSPCFPCARKLISVGVQKMVYIGNYANAQGQAAVVELCAASKVEVTVVDPATLPEVVQEAFDFMQGSGGVFKNFLPIKVECLRHNKIILGFTGQLRAGKGTVLQLLTRGLAGKHTVSAHRGSDLINDMLKRLDIPISRSNQQGISTHMREVLGEDVLVNGIRSRVLKDHAEIVIIDGMRRKVDLQLLQSLGGKLVAVCADQHIRYQRNIIANERTGDAEMTFEQFQERDIAETEELIPWLVERADIKIDNSSDRDHLRRQVDDILLKGLGLQ